MGIPDKFGFPFFICGEIQKLGDFEGRIGQRPPLIREVFILDHQEYSRITGLALAKFQIQGCEKQLKMPKMRAVQMSSAVGLETMPKAWRPCWRHGDHAKGMRTRPKSWRPYWGHGDHAKGMGTMAKTWRPCQRHGDHAKGMVTMLKEWPSF